MKLELTSNDIVRAISEYFHLPHRVRYEHIINEDDEGHPVLYFPYPHDANWPASDECEREQHIRELKLTIDDLKKQKVAVIVQMSEYKEELRKLKGEPKPPIHSGGAAEMK